MDITKENSKHEARNPKCINFRYLNFIFHSNFEFRISNLLFKAGFTLIELLIVIAVIALLTGLLIPMVDRSLARNRLAIDLAVFKAKLEETRLLAGSTRQVDENKSSSSTSEDAAGYYGIYIPTLSIIQHPDNAETNTPFFAIVRISRSANVTNQFAGQCHPNQATYDSLINSGPCLVERINFSRGASFVHSTVTEDRIISFKVPTQELFEIRCPSCNNPTDWQVDHSATAFKSGNAYFGVNYRGKVGQVRIEPYSGKVTIEF